MGTVAPVTALCLGLGSSFSSTGEAPHEGPHGPPRCSPVVQGLVSEERHWGL